MGTRVRDSVIIALFLVCMYLVSVVTYQFTAIDELQKRQDTQEKRMSTYEKRTTDALDNWDSMRKTQLVLMDLLQPKN